MTEVARTYSQRQRQTALEVYVERGAAEASRRTGVPRGTISWWAKRDGKTSPRAAVAVAAAESMRRTWVQRRAEVATAAGEAAEDFLARAVASSRSRDVRNLMGAFEAAVRAAQLLGGETTGRSEPPRKHLVDAEVDRLLRVMDRDRGLRRSS